jgi:hypothetical protein
MGRAFPEILCQICSKAVDLRIDLCANEDGLSVHEDCYVEKTASRNTEATTSISRRYLAA